jgi:hypothetical protein
MSDEREILAASLPSENDPVWAEYEAKLRSTRPGCPLMGDVIGLAMGQRIDEALAHQMREHFKVCAYCKTCFEAYQGTAEEPAIRGSLLEELSKGLQPKRNLLATLVATVAGWGRRLTQRTSPQPALAFADGQVVALVYRRVIRVVWGTIAFGVVVLLVGGIGAAHIIGLNNALRARLDYLHQEIGSLGIAKAVPSRDAQLFSVVESSANRVRVAGDFNRLFIQELRVHWGDEPMNTYTTLYKGGPRPDPTDVNVPFDPASMRVSFAEVKEYKLNGDVIAATLEFVPYPEIQELFPDFFPSERTQFSRAFYLGNDGIQADYEMVVVKEPKDGAKVNQNQDIEGKLGQKQGWPVLLVRAIDGDTRWWVQEPVDSVAEGGEFTAAANIGDNSTPAETRFSIVVIVAPSKQAALTAYPAGKKMVSLPSLPRSKYITVIRE